MRPTLWLGVAAMASGVVVPAIGATTTSSSCAVREFPGTDTVATTPWAHGLIESMPDGNLWFGEGSSLARIQAKSPNAITKFATTPPGVTNDVAAGPDGSYWFTEIIGDKVGRITPRKPNTMTEFRLPTPASAPDAIVAGRDGRMWFTEWAGRLGAIDTRPPYKIQEFATPTTTVVHKLVVDHQGRLWFTEPFADKIGRVVLDANGTPTITEFSMAPHSFPTGLAVARNGAVWVSEAAASRIVSFMPGKPSKLAEYALPSPTAFPLDITTGPGKYDVWFTEVGANAIGELSFRTPHAVPTYRHCSVPNTPYFLTTGPDRNLWFTEFHDPGIRVGRLTP